jgi:hypothetical protein
MCESFVSKDQGFFLKSPSGNAGAICPNELWATASEEQGKMLKVAPESTIKDSLPCLSFQNNNPELSEKDICCCPVNVGETLLMWGLLHREGVPFPYQRKGDC